MVMVILEYNTIITKEKGVFNQTPFLFPEIEI